MGLRGIWSDALLGFFGSLPGFWDSTGGMSTALFESLSAPSTGEEPLSDPPVIERTEDRDTEMDEPLVA